MKRICIVVAIFFVSFAVSAQPDNDIALKMKIIEQPACDTRVELADSSINFTYDSSEKKYIPASVIINYYNQTWNLTTVICKTLPGRENVYRQIFDYNEDQSITRYTYQLWAFDGWSDNLINERTYNSDGLINEEVFIREDAQGVFTPYQRHTYTHSDGRVTGYIRQILDPSGNWYDFSEHVYVYDFLGRLTVLYGKYFNSDLIYWERTSVYGSDGKISDRFLKLLRYDPVERRNILNYSTLQKYHYNIFGNADTVLNYEFNRSDQQWEHRSRDVGYFSLIRNKKVSICHAGRNTCVLATVVQMHLEHGDKLGECTTLAKSGRADRSELVKKPNSGIRLYPNPAAINLTAKIEGEGNGYCTATIFSSDGKSILTSDVSGQQEITFNISALKSGTYYLVLMNENGYETRPFVKK